MFENKAVDILPPIIIVEERPDSFIAQPHPRWWKLGHSLLRKKVGFAFLKKKLGFYDLRKRSEHTIPPLERPLPSEFVKKKKASRKQFPRKQSGLKCGDGKRNGCSCQQSSDEAKISQDILVCHAHYSENGRDVDENRRWSHEEVKKSEDTIAACHVHDDDDEKRNDFHEVNSEDTFVHHFHDDDGHGHDDDKKNGCHEVMKFGDILVGHVHNTDDGNDQINAEKRNGCGECFYEVKSSKHILACQVPDYDDHDDGGKSNLCHEVKKSAGNILACHLHGRHTDCQVKKSEDTLSSHVHLHDDDEDNCAHVEGKATQIAAELNAVLNGQLAQSAEEEEVHGIFISAHSDSSKTAEMLCFTCGRRSALEHIEVEDGASSTIPEEKKLASSSDEVNTGLFSVPTEDKEDKELINLITAGAKDDLLSFPTEAKELVSSMTTVRDGLIEEKELVSHITAVKGGLTPERELAMYKDGLFSVSKEFTDPPLLGDGEVHHCSVVEEGTCIDGLGGLQHCSVVEENTGIHGLAEKELMAKAMVEEATSIHCLDEADLDVKALSESQDGEVKHLPKRGYDEVERVNTAQSKQAGLSPGGISEQQTHFMFLFAGLVIQALGFQLKSMVEVGATIILLFYRAYLFGCDLINQLSQAKGKLTEKQMKLLVHVTEMSFLFKERWLWMKPLLIAGAKKMGWGCLRATCVFAMLTALLFTSFLLSYIAVKSSFTHKPIQIREALYFDYTRSHPVASLDLYSFKDYPRESNTSKGMKGPVNRFHATVFLTLPESDYNRELGVFQVACELLSATGQVLVKSSQPCMLHFKSNTLHYIKSILMAIPLLAGVSSETQTLALHLLEWQEERSSPSAGIRISLVPRAGRPVTTGLPELYNAEIQVDSEAPCMASSSVRSWKWTLLMWIGLSFLVFVCLASLYLFRLQRHHVGASRNPDTAEVM